MKLNCKNIPIVNILRAAFSPKKMQTQTVSTLKAAYLKLSLANVISRLM